MQAGKVQTHLDAQFGVQVRERFIKHKDARVTHDGAAYCHALALPARKLFRFAVQQVGELQRFCHHLHLVTDLFFWDLIHFQPVAHVFGDRHVRIERIGLKNHGHAAVGRRDVIHDLLR